MMIISNDKLGRHNLFQAAQWSITVIIKVVTQDWIFTDWINLTLNGGDFLLPKLLGLD